MDLKILEIFLLSSETKAAMHKNFLKAVIKYDFSLKLLDLVQPIHRDVPMSSTSDGSHAHWYILYCQIILFFLFKK